MNLGMWRIWKHLPHVELLAQVHDSICFQFPEACVEEDLIAMALSLTRVRQVDRLSRREMIVGAEAKVGWNWGNYDVSRNPEGMKKWTPSQKDTRKRNENGRRL